MKNFQSGIAALDLNIMARIGVRSMALVPMADGVEPT